MRTKIYRDPDWLKAKYWDENLSTGQVADLGGCSAEQIRYWMIKHNIPRRQSGEACSLRWKNDPALRQWRSTQSKLAWEQGCFEGRFTEEVLVRISRNTVAAHARGCYDMAHKIQSEKLKAAWARGAYDDRVNNSSAGIKAAWAAGKFDHIFTEERRKKVSISIKAAHARGAYDGIDHNCYWKGKRGPGTPNWRGGLSFEIYPVEFDESFKLMIRERDGYKCAICRLFGKSVHHINYVKEGTVPENCITLCRSCHSVTNGDRDYWQQELSNLMHARGISL